MYANLRYPNREARLWTSICPRTSQTSLPNLTPSSRPRSSRSNARTSSSSTIAASTRAPIGRTTDDPRAEWRALISEMERRADKAGHLRYGLPKSCGGSAASNLAIAAIREHLAGKGLGLHNDLQDESSIVGNFPIIPALADYGTPEQKTYIEGIITGKKHLSFGLTEPGHGSDATWLETTGRSRRRHVGHQRPQALELVRSPARTLNLCSRALRASRARRRGSPRSSCRPTAPGHNILYNHWTFNMPSDHAETELKDVRVPDSAILHQGGRRARRRAALRPREPHPPGGGERGRGALLHSGGGQIRQFARRFRRAAREETGGPVSARRALGGIRNGAQLHLPNRLADGSAEPARDQRHGVDLQFPREPALLRGRRPRDAGAWRHGLQPRACRSSISIATTAAIASPRAREEVQMRRVAQYLFGFSGKRATTR